MRLRSLGRLWRTLRHLRARQVRYQLLRKLLRPGPPAPLALRWRPIAPGVPREKNTTRVYAGADVFTFNNETRPFGGDWNDSGARKLWLYNLHYMGWIFDFAEPSTPEAFARREAWIARWIEDNPADARGNGWEPYPLSLRLFYWCKHYAMTGAEPSAKTRRSLEEQAGGLLAQLEFHIDANHLLENLLALTFVGFFLDPADSRAMRARARIAKLVREELAAQFLADGGHYELSPMYHAILLERILDLLNCWPGGEDPFPGLREQLRGTAVRGLSWLDAMSVGGRFSLFNDACYDGAPQADLLVEYGTLLGLFRASSTESRLRALPDSGYYRAAEDGWVVIFDAGKLAPDHQMGHAQGDLLSFCLWVDGLPVLVPPGNFEYVPGAMRDYCRSTAAHNTLVPNGAEQAEWWGAHRVGRRARPLGVSAREDSGSGGIRLQGTHDGYSGLPGNPLHTRELLLTVETLEIRDTLSGDPGCVSRVLFHLHPDCTAEIHGEGVRIRTPAGDLSLRADAPLRLEEGWHCPEFGLRLRNQVVIAEGPGVNFRAVLSRTSKVPLTSEA